MVIFDIITISLTLISSLLGLSRGFIKELLSTSKWLLASFVAFISFEKTKIILSKFFKDSAILDLIAGGSIFILTFYDFQTFQQVKRTDKSRSRNEV